MRSKHTTTLGDVPFTLERSGARWKVRFCWRGKRIQESTGTSDLATARAWAHRRISEETRAPAAKGTEVLVGVAVDLFCTERAKDRPAGHPGRNERFPLRRFAESAPRLDLSDHDRTCDAVRAYFKGRHVSPVTLDDERRILHRFFAWLGENRLVAYPANPAARKDLHLPTEVRAPRPPANAADLERLLAAARGHRLYPVLVLMCSGFRLSGVRRLEWEGVDWPARTVRVTEKRLERVVPLSSWAIEALQACRARGPIWPFGAGLAHRDLAGLRQRLGIPPALTFGAMRRAAYTRLYQAGVPPQKAARIMGNSVQVAMRHYVDLESVHAHDAAEVLGLVQKLVQPETGKKQAL